MGFLPQNRGGSVSDELADLRELLRIVNEKLFGQFFSKFRLSLDGIGGGNDGEGIGETSFMTWSCPWARVMSWINLPGKSARG